MKYMIDPFQIKSYVCMFLMAEKCHTIIKIVMNAFFLFESST